MQAVKDLNYKVSISHTCACFVISNKSGFLIQISHCDRTPGCGSCAWVDSRGSSPTRSHYPFTVRWGLGISAEICEWVALHRTTQTEPATKKNYDPSEEGPVPFLRLYRIQYQFCAVLSSTGLRECDTPSSLHIPESLLGAKLVFVAFQNLT